MPTNEQLFFAHVAPLALAIEERTTKYQTGVGRTAGMFAAVVVAQCADESGWHVEGVCEGKEGWLGVRNYAGISPNKKIANFATDEDFINSYVSTIEQNEYGFPDVLTATNPVLQIIRLGRSEWAGSQYDRAGDGRPGKDVLSIYQNHLVDIETALSNAQTIHAVAPPYTAAVEAFQAAHDLAADGIVGPLTWNVMFGLAPGTLTEEQYQRSVKTFQTAHGLVPDGIVGPLTWGAYENPQKKNEDVAATTSPPAPVTQADSLMAAHGLTPAAPSTTHTILLPVVLHVTAATDENGVSYQVTGVQPQEPGN